MNKWNPWRVSTTKVVATAISWCEQKHTIENMRQWLQAHALPAPPTDYLHHYTSRVGLGHNESLVRMIAGEVFYFSNPMHFNDPLDLLPRIVAEKPADSDGVMVIAGLPSGGSGPGPVNTHPGLAESLARIRESFAHEGKDLARVFCTSESPDNALMWAHYAGRHTGICVELDWTKLYPPWLPQKVVYKEKMTLAESSVARVPFQVPHSCLKTPEWAYEREWRLVRHVQDKADTCFVNLSGAVRSVIFGTRMSRQDQARIFNLICTCVPHVRIKQAYFDGAKICTYEVPRSLAARGAKLRPQNPQLDLDALPDNYFNSTLDVEGVALREFGCAVGVGKADQYARRVLEFFGGVHRNADELLSAIQVVLPDLSHLPICEVAWEIICSASRYSNDVPLKDAVSRWCPEEYIPLLSDFQQADFSEKERRRSMLATLLFHADGNRFKLAVMELDQLEIDAKAWGSADRSIVSSVVFWCAKRFQHTGVPEADAPRLERLLSFASTIKSS